MSSKAKTWWDMVYKPREEKYVECPEWLRANDNNGNLPTLEQ